MECDASKVIEFDQHHGMPEYGSVRLSISAPPWTRPSPCHRSRCLCASAAGSELNGTACSLRRQKAPGEPQAILLFRLKDAHAGVLASLSQSWFRAHEHRRHHHLVTEHEAIEVQVVAIDLPAPWLVRRRCAKHTQPVHSFAILVPATGNFADRMVEPHDIASTDD